MKRKNTGLILKIICVLQILFGSVAFFAAKWYVDTYGDTGFDSILFTLFSNLSGVENDLIISYLLKSLLPAVILAALVSFILLWDPKNVRIEIFKSRNGGFRVFPCPEFLKIACSFILCVCLIFVGSFKVDLPNWAISKLNNSEIYEKDYVKPTSQTVTFPENKRNLIYIFLESMETTYLSKEYGGAETDNLIPNLQKLAEENTNFSHTNGVGGWGNVTNTTWTVASLVAQTAGVPLNISENNYTDNNKFMSGITTINDVLHDNGYYQAIMFGSDASFGNRDKYFSTHSVDDIFDLFSARKDKIIPEDYYVWWGMEDKYLFEYAKQKLNVMSKSDKPFAFSLLTVDTHHIGGYVCSECTNEHKNQYENVIACSDRQVSDFVKWIKEQDFYKNTTIVLCGDHRSMDAEYFEKNISSDYDRHIYNCFINSAVETTNTKNRILTPMDMFPTTLAALGCTLKNNRLAMGVNLFSKNFTLAEIYGAENFNAELKKTSKYYEKNFS